MRGSQSDPTHAYAPVCPCSGACYARVNAGGARAGARARDYHALSWLSRAGKARVWRGYNKRFNGPTAGFWGWPIGWPRRGVLRALAGLWRALLGLCVWLAMLGACGRACDACFHCAKPQCWACIQHGMVYGLAYVLAYGIALAWPALGVWLMLAGGLLAVNI